MDPLLLSTVAPITFEYKMIFANFSSTFKIDSMTHLKVLLQKFLKFYRHIRTPYFFVAEYSTDWFMFTNIMYK